MGKHKNPKREEERERRRVRLEREYERKQLPWEDEEEVRWLYIVEQIVIFSGVLVFLIGFWYIASSLVIKLLQRGGGK